MEVKYNKEKDRIECLCGHAAVKLRGGWVCGTITAYPCEYVRKKPEKTVNKIIHDSDIIRTILRRTKNGSPVLE